MSKIDELKAKIAYLEQNGGREVKSPVWGVLDDKTKDLSPQEAAAINATAEVNAAYQKMMGAFSGYFLFPKFRDEFASIPAFRPLCDKYIAAVLQAKADRYKYTAELEEENKRLKAELEAARRG